MTNKNKKPSFINQLSNVAVYVFPYLNPTELSTISLTCKTLSKIAKTITTVRSSDASRTYEKHPIPFINTTTDNHPYAYFTYTSTQTLTGDLTRQPWGSAFDVRPNPSPSLVPLKVENGCLCEGEICGCECVCVRREVNGLKWECGSGCGCGMECGNRVGQKGVILRLKIVRSEKKGWGLYADEFIKCGELVCEYAGEMLTTTEARKRQLMYDKRASAGKHTSALLVVREHLPSGNACMRINIDATRIGNVARFINHSCDGGNLSTVLVRSLGSLLPRVCFFASRDILKDEELNFSYGDAGLNPNGSKCFCGSSCCSGIMSSEHT
ncbi:histone-lysine N-methyltransferase SUVR3 [Rutidosis leptorrhynchoides]|uniref:histone-lysine N-methyltransferase SUVR3 n=1 Tax=Rutidosis leptorrhynchoides TaxID=125765 RepID=UPI003A99A412